MNFLVIFRQICQSAGQKSTLLRVTLLMVVGIASSFSDTFQPGFAQDARPRPVSVQGKVPTPLQLTIVTDPRGATVRVNGIESGTTGNFKDKAVSPAGDGTLLLELSLSGYRPWSTRISSASLSHARSVYLFRQLVEEERIPTPPPLTSTYCNQPGTRQQQVDLARNGLPGELEIDNLRICLMREQRWSECVPVTRRLCDFPGRQSDCDLNLAFCQYKTKRYADCLSSLVPVLRTLTGLDPCDQMRAHQLRISCKADVFSASSRPGEPFPPDLNDWIDEFDNMLGNIESNVMSPEEKACARESRAFLKGLAGAR